MASSEAIWLPVAAGVILLLMAVLVVYVEVVKLRRLRLTLQRFPRHCTSSSSSTQPVEVLSAAPLAGPAVLGSYSSPHRLLFGAKGASIFTTRERFANTSATYFCAKWQLRDCFLSSTRPLNGLVITSDPDVVYAVLSNAEDWIKLGAFSRSSSLASISALACTSATGENSIRQRRILSRAMPNKKSLLMLVKRAGEFFIEQVSLQREAHSAVDILPAIYQSCLRLITELVFGRLGAKTERFMAVYMPFWELVRTNVVHLSAAQRRERMTAIATGVSAVRACLAELITAPEDQELPSSSSEQEKRMLDHLREHTEAAASSSNPPHDMLSPEELLHNLHNLVTAAFETTAHTLAASLFFLSSSAEQQELARGDREYLKWVVRESLRLLPPVLQTSRVSTKTITAGPLTFPPQMTVMVDFLALMRSEKHWGPSASSFHPQRWANLAPDSPLRKLWLPFGTGPKSCLGRSLAMDIVEQMLGTFLAQFRFRSASKNFKPDFAQTPTLRFKGKLVLIVTKGIARGPLNSSERA